jgi:uncharacterized protein (TIGR03086 family)
MNTSPETANGPALMAAAAAEATRVVAGAANTKTLEQTTPCTDRAYGESVAEELMSKDFTAEPGYAQAYQAQIARAVDAWSKPEAWAGDRNVMGSATPAADIAAMLIAEMVLHGWDIAQATGQDYRCDDGVAQAVLETVRAQGELFRQYQGFAAIVSVPADATAFDHALALSGRDPGWKPGS